MAAASIIARLLQAGTRQGQKAAAALLRMLKKSNPATLEKNVYKEYGNLGRSALSKDILGPLSKFRPPRPSMTKERAMALDRVRKAASHGFPKGVKNTPGGMKTTKRGFQYRDATPNLGDITMRAPYVGFAKDAPAVMKTRPKGLRELRSLERTAERSFNFPRKDFKPTSFKQFRRGTKRKNARKLAELRKYVDWLSRGGAG